MITTYLDGRVSWQDDLTDEQLAEELRKRADDARTIERLLVFRKTPTPTMDERIPHPLNRHERREGA